MCKAVIRKKEVDFYEEIASEIVNQIKSHLTSTNHTIRPLIGEIGSGLRTLIANGYNAGSLLKGYSRSVHRLHLDISIVIENTTTGKFEIIIFEVKRVNKLGLGELSQLIGYCLVSKAKYGILINIDKNVSTEFSIIIDGDDDLTDIIRIIDNKKLRHRFGVMIWNSCTFKVEYTNSGAIKSIPQLVEEVENNLL